MLALLVMQVLVIVIMKIGTLGLQDLEVMPEQLQHTLGRWVIVVAAEVLAHRELRETQILEILEM